VAAEALGQSMLESKDKDQLLAIAQALGIKTTARAAKATLISKILEMTGATSAPAASAPVAEAAPVAASEAVPVASEVPAAPSTNGQSAAPRRGSAGRSSATGAARADRTDVSVQQVEPADEVVLGPDGEPLSDWEIELLRSGDATPATAGSAEQVAAPADTRAGDDADGDDGDDGGAGEGLDGESRNARRRRRRRKGRGGDGPQGSDRYEGGRSEGGRPEGRSDGGRSEAGGQRERGDRWERGDRGDRGDRSEQGSDQQQSAEPIQVGGYLDLRDEGYGFLRVNGYLASKEDPYIPVKLTRQFGLRKGDHVTGLSRPAGRNEKNPAMLEIHAVNGADPEKAKVRPRFEDLTALFPDERLRLENPADPANMTARIIDLISPIGKGQRGIIVSPPKAGKTTIMKTIATSIERNHPEVRLMVLLIDERPEEVTDMRRTVRGEVIASTFDRPSDEHTHVAELAIEKAKRMVELGDDVIVILDGITRLSRAYNLAAPASGRILSGGIDAGALYPPKKFFGAARNIEEGGSLTILATALVETNSRMDDAIFEEFKGTGNMELRLDRKLSERRIYPAIDVDASSTRHEELLFDRKQLQMVWKLRRVLSGLAADGNAAPGLELLVDRLKTFRTNDEFLNEIAKQPSM
jgi:transcription termination factor Rho